MRQRVGRRRLSRQITGNTARLGVLALCFVCSGVLGCLFSASAGEEGGAEITSFLKSYLFLVAEGTARYPGRLEVLWELCRWPLAAALLGFASLGVVGIPLLFCARGFLAAYAVAAFYRVFGVEGLPAALSLFGAALAFSVPVLFAVGNVSLASALELSGGAGREGGRFARIRLYVGCAPVCGGILAAGVLVQTAVLPQLLEKAAANLIEIMK